jgi:hypothetical protein
MQRLTIAFLFGAGASHGAQGIEPFRPPLGGGLYPELKREFPETWGALDDDEVTAFGPERTEFEAGMKLLWEKFDERAWWGLIDVGKYFARFRPPMNQSDCYSRLVIALRALGLIESVRVATLNYECLLEVASCRVGVGINYSGEPNPGTLAVAKPHGSCNFLVDMKMYGVAVVGNPNAQQLVMGPLEVITDLDEIERKYSSGYSIPPIMSMFAEGKQTPVNAQFVAGMRDDWRRWTDEADVIVVVGARPYFRDGHIWDRIVESSAAVWYIGGTEDDDFSAFATQLGARLVCIGSRFNESLKPLLERLRDVRDRSLVIKATPANGGG